MGSKGRKKGRKPKSNVESRIESRRNECKNAVAVGRGGVSVSLVPWCFPLAGDEILGVDEPAWPGPGIGGTEEDGWAGDGD